METKKDKTNKSSSCLGALVFIFAIFATAFGFWKLGYGVGSQDALNSESTKLLTMQWTSSIKTRKADFMNKINAYRLEHGAPPLKTNPLLEKTAEAAAYSIYIGQRAWNHIGYESSISGQYRGWFIVGENLARNFNDFDFMLRSWELSPEHNANLLEKDFCEGGMGIYAYVWVLHLGCR